MNIMNFSRAFTYIFDDKNWVRKLVIGGLLTISSLLIIPVPFVLGYLAKAVKAASSRQKDILPDWTDWINLYKIGLNTLIIIGAYLLMLGFANKFLEMIPFFGNLNWILNTFFSFVIPVPVIIYVTNGKINQAFNPESLKNFIVDNFVDLFLIWIVNLILIPIFLSGVFVMFFGLFFTLFYTLLVRSYLYGNLYRIRKRKKQIFTSKK
jgi:hypothetical protein